MIGRVNRRQRDRECSSLPLRVKPGNRVFVAFGEYFGAAAERPVRGDPGERPSTRIPSVEVVTWRIGATQAGLGHDHFHGLLRHEPQALALGTRR